MKRSFVRHSGFVALMVCGCGGSGARATTTPAPPKLAEPSVAATDLVTPAPVTTVSTSSSEPRTLTNEEFPLPGATGPASLDFIAYEPAASRVWVPVGQTGSVAVFDIASKTFRRVDGFTTVEREARGKKRTFGPSAVSIGDGYAYVGNRATSEVCSIDVKSLKLSGCVKLDSGTDGVAYVASTKEVWVATPDAHTLVVLDASKAGTLTKKSSVKLEGAPECYAVDDSRGLFFTNLEDKGGTSVIDLKTRRVTATWQPGCGEDGPRGLAFDASRNFLMVACTDHIQVLDAGHNGAQLGKLATGAGVDTIDYVAATQLLYVGAAKAKRLSVAHLDDRGVLSVVATATTPEGVRNAVGDASGNAYAADAASAKLLVFPNGVATTRD